MMFYIFLQIKECIEAAKEVVKYFKNKTAVHSLLDKARKHVKVSVLALQCQSLMCITHCIRHCSQSVGTVAVVLRVYVKMISVYSAVAVAAGYHRPLLASGHTLGQRE